MKYDVAFSFRAADLSFAEELRSRLEPPMKCFVYARKQDEIAGTDGMETFREVFRTESRLNVVLYRDGWGSTPWTGVEEVAIRESCLQCQYRNLLFVRLDGADVPRWIPDSHQMFDRRLYNDAELIGVIKSRVAALGGDIRPQTVGEKVAARAAREAEELDTRRFLDSEEAVKLARKGFSDLRSKLKEETDRIAISQPKWAPRFGQGSPNFFEFYFGGVRLVVAFEHYANSVRDCRFECEFFLYTSNNWRKMDDASIDITRTPSLGLCWAAPDGGYMDSGALAEWLLHRMIAVRDAQP